MIRNSKPAIQHSNTKKTSGKNPTDAATRKALAVTEANLARIEAQENSTPAPDDAPASKLAKSKKAKAEKVTKPTKDKLPRKVSLLDHAEAVLAKSSEPLTCKSIIEKVLASTDWKSDGKTPHATLYSAVIREIAAKGNDSRFKKMDRGMFAASN